MNEYNSLNNNNDKEHGYVDIYKITTTTTRQRTQKSKR